VQPTSVAAERSPDQAVNVEAIKIWLIMDKMFLQKIVMKTTVLKKNMTPQTQKSALQRNTMT